MKQIEVTRVNFETCLTISRLNNNIKSCKHSTIFKGKSSDCFEKSLSMQQLLEMTARRLKVIAACLKKLNTQRGFHNRLSYLNWNPVFLTTTVFQWKRLNSETIEILNSTDDLKCIWSVEVSSFLISCERKTNQRTSRYETRLNYSLVLCYGFLMVLLWSVKRG